MTGNISEAITNRQPFHNRFHSQFHISYLFALLYAKSKYMCTQSMITVSYVRITFICNLLHLMWKPYQIALLPQHNTISISIFFEKSIKLCRSILAPNIVCDFYVIFMFYVLYTKLHYAHYLILNKTLTYKYHFQEGIKLKVLL